MRPVTEITRLDRHSLGALFNRDTVGLILRRFCDPELAALLADWFRGNPQKSNYRITSLDGQLRDSDTDRVGTPLSELYPYLFDLPESDPRQEIAVEAFNARAVTYAQQLKDVCAPAAPPVDALMQILAACWPGGAQLLRFENVSPCAGIGRVMDSSVGRPQDAEPHLDWLPSVLAPFDEQFSAIIYLDVPPEGGELEVWDVDRDEMLALIDHQGSLRRTDLPRPRAIKPGRGDMVLINTRYPHAVRGFASGTRIVQSCFIGLYDAQEPLFLWS